MRILHRALISSILALYWGSACLFLLLRRYILLLLMGLSVLLNKVLRHLLLHGHLHEHNLEGVFRKIGVIDHSLNDCFQVFVR